MAPKKKSALSYAGDALAGVLMAPVATVAVGMVLWDSAITQPRARKKYNKQLDEAKAIPFAGTGTRRPLTPGSSPSNQGAKAERSQQVQKTQAQNQSILFSCASEIRAMIWELCLGGHTFWIDREEVASTTQAKQQRHSDKHPQAVYKFTHWIHSPDCAAPLFCVADSHRFKVKHLMSLLMTCRQVYAETLPLLYQSNYFIIHNPSAPLNGKRSLWSSGRFNLLTSLTTTFVIPTTEYIHRGEHDVLWGDQMSWNENWRTIASLAPHLRHLEVTIQRWYGTYEQYDPSQPLRVVMGQWYAGIEHTFMPEIMKVATPKKWILCLAWPEWDPVPHTPGLGYYEQQTKHLQMLKGNQMPFEIRRVEPLGAPEEPNLDFVSVL